MNEKEYLEQSLRLLQILGQEKLKRLPNDPRNKFKYTVGGSRCETEFYTNSIKKAKEKMLQMCEEHRGLVTVQNSKTFETILSCSAGAE
tara:strand:+ start:254 stop:520 length:267 start_codon:yes stop_codon:yes gene_type:complete